jgi:flagellar biogenesis protein FliO
MSFSPVMAQNLSNLLSGRRFLSAFGVWYKLILFFIFMAGSLYVRPLFAASDGDVVASEVATVASEVATVASEVATVASEVATVSSEVAVAASEVTAEPIDLLQEGLEVAGYLLILMVFAVVVIRLGKRFQPRMGASGLIRVEDGHNLAPGVGVRLISVGSRAWLVGVTKERVSILAEMSQEEMQTAKEGSA